jgi:hypothetical protein
MMDKVQKRNICTFLLRTITELHMYWALSINITFSMKLLYVNLRPLNRYHARNFYLNEVHVTTLKVSQTI